MTILKQSGLTLIQEQVMLGQALSLFVDFFLCLFTLINSIKLILNDNQNQFVSYKYISFSRVNQLINMQNVADKCFLGLALSQTIEDLNLNKQKDIIMDIYRNVFKRKFEQRQKQPGLTNTIKSEFLVENQYPIDSSARNEKNEKQYYRAILYHPTFGNPKITQIFKNKQFALVQGYSTNEDAKRQKINKKRETKQKSGTPRKIRNKN